MIKDTQRMQLSKEQIEKSSILCHISLLGFEYNEMRFYFIFRNAFFLLLMIPQLLAAQIGIGTNSPSSSAKLDVVSTTKGVLMPRMTKTQREAISTPATGLMVYQTDDVSGFYYYSGSQWQLLDKQATKLGTVTKLDLANARIEPSTYTSGSSYTGSLIIPYTGGNGGAYDNGSDISSTGTTGLTATLKAGTLNSGSGELVYNVSGTPNKTSPNTASFTIPNTLSATGGTVTVGGGRLLKVGEIINASYSVPKSTACTTSFELSSYVTTNSLAALPIVDSLQANLQGVSSDFYKPKITNRANSARIISYQTFSTDYNQNESGVNLSIASGSSEFVDYSTGEVYWSTSIDEVVTTNVIVQIGTVYRWYEFKWWSMEVGSDKNIFISIFRKL